MTPRCNPLAWITLAALAAGGIGTLVPSLSRREPAPEGYERSQAALSSHVVRESDPHAIARRGLKRKGEVPDTPAAEDITTTARSDPEKGARLLIARHPEDPSGVLASGDAVVRDLVTHGAHDAAVRFALAAAPWIGSDEHTHWLRHAFESWGAHSPEGAATAAIRLPDHGQRFEALLHVLDPWIRSDPAGVTAFVQHLPDAWDRRNAMGHVLEAWVSSDPVRAAAWIDQREPTPDLDAGAAALALLPTLAARHPDVALSWATSIVDPQLRARTIREVVHQVALVDTDAAARLVAVNPELLADAVPVDPVQ